MKRKRHRRDGASMRRDAGIPPTFSNDDVPLKYARMSAPAGDFTNTMIRRFQVARLIARGGMGEVYLATDAVLGRDLALKVLRQDVTRDRDRIGRFIQEARAASALNHPHLIAVYDIGESAPRRDGEAVGPPVHYIAMELVEGHTLRQVIAEKRLSLHERLRCLEQVADALAAAHTAGVVHRDLKPENLMIAANGYAKVLDFGVAKLRGEIAETSGHRTLSGSTMTTDGMILGTVGYVSPEQAQGLPLDHRSDIFSFGCVLYEAITGERAFHASTAVETLQRVVEAEPTPLLTLVPAAPPGLERVVRSCLAKDPAHRYPTMRDVAADLRAVRRNLEDGSRTPAIGRRSAVIALGAGALAAVGGWWALRERNTPAPAPTIERLTSTGTAIDAAISRDGRHLAWVASSGGQQGLRVRELAGTSEIELVPPAAVGFWGIAFSPDGRHIYYATKSVEEPAGRLYVVPITGGAARPLLEGIDSTVTFAPDGSRFAFYRAAHPERGATALVVAGVDGTGAQMVTRTAGREFFVPAFFAAPSWSPDGSRIAAAVHDGQSGTARLITVTVSDGAREPFARAFEDVTFTAWLPDGSGILMIANQTDGLREYPRKVWLQPFPTGDPRRITRDVLEYRNISVRGDGAFVSVGLDSAYSLWRVPLGGGSPRRIASERYDGLLGIAPLADGRIVVSAGERGNTQLALLDAEGARREQLTNEGQNLWPAASPDGRSIAFVSNRDGHTGIWRMTLSARDARLLAHLPSPSWVSVTPDGRFVVCATVRDGETTTWRVPMDGGEPTIVATGLDRPAVSPDGRWIVGINVRPGASQLALVMMPADGSGEMRTLGTIAPATGNGLLEWTAEGDAILFSTVERANVWRQSLAGGSPTKVTSLADLGIARGRRSVDGRTLILARGTAQTDAYLVSNYA